VVAQGPPATLSGEESHTARWLNTPVQRTLSPGQRLARSPGAIVVEGATEHNLKSINVRFPLSTLICVTGVSGSGKSTLVQDVLAAEAARVLYRSGRRVGAHKRITGLDAIDKLVAIDQSPIGRTPRSTPATYTGVFDEIRRVFATTRDAKIRGFKSGRFSFNAKGGRCEVCQGQGFKRLEMQYLADQFIRCDACDGARFNRSTLEVRYKSKNIAEVLDMRVDQALAFFDAIPKVRQGLDAMHRAGLGYMTLGQSSTTLSGGEAQRVKLAAELGKLATGRTLYILDEPTTGLHADDVRGLIAVLVELADLGNTIVLIEHNLDVIADADWVIDLGPGGGAEGGHVVAQGTVDIVGQTPESVTGKYLRQET
jgi:excinuclease ABC subunit A